MKEKYANGAQWKQFLRPLLFGLIVGTAAAFVLLLLLAFILTAANLSARAAAPVSAVAAGAGALLAGLTAAKMHGHRGLIMGVLSAALLYIVVLFASLAAGNGDFTASSLTRLLIMLLSGMVGGILGSRQDGTKRRKFI